ncbi:DUF4240 domain-containing protein [Kitasatospora sp. NPDC004799]|uniref:DUF4240 domain-containing protein n=1 Tax=Kitasatospora sp. NPDC004799 TaxID=3154460 RepID=UPI0033A8BA32
MDTDDFWAAIDSARADIRPDHPFHQALTDRLAALGVPAVIAFEERYQQLHRRLYRWDVWAAGYLIGGGCSDDGFTDFRAGLIAQGREWYDRAAAHPDGLADHPGVVDEERFFYEEAGYAAYYAYARLMADEDANLYEACEGGGADQEPAGEDFDFDDDAEMHRRLPRLAALLLGPVPGSSAD